jgi:hypothetical protein
MNSKKVLYLFIAIVVIILLLFGMNTYLSSRVSDEPEGIDTPQVEVISIDNMVVPDQAAGSEVFIEKVLLKSDGAGGYVVIHRVGEDGAPGEIIGSSQYLEPGVTQNFLVSLYDGQTVDVGDRVIAMLHTDDGDKAFDATLDGAIVDDLGAVVMVTFNILAEEDIPGFETKL